MKRSTDTNTTPTAPIVSAAQKTQMVLFALAMGLAAVVACSAQQKQTIKDDVKAGLECAPDIGVRLAAAYSQCRQSASPDDSPWGCVAIAALQVGPDSYVCVKLHIAHQNADGGAESCPFEKVILTPMKERL